MEELIAWTPLANERNDFADRVIESLMSSGKPWSRLNPVDDVDDLRKVRYLVHENIHHRIVVDLHRLTATFRNKARLSGVTIRLEHSQVGLSRFYLEWRKMRDDQMADSLAMRRTKQDANWDLVHRAELTSRSNFTLN